MKARILLIVLIIFSMVKLYADISPESGSITVGGDFNYPPYEFINENGQPDGFNVELTRLIADHLDIKVNIQLGEWSTIRNLLEEGKIDLVQGVFYSKERHKVFSFTNAHNQIVHTVALHDDESVPYDINSIRGAKIGVMRGDIMHDFLLNNKLTNDIVLTSTQEELLELLNEKKIEYALLAKIPALYWIQKNKLNKVSLAPYPLEVIDYCYATKIGNENIAYMVSDALQKVMMSDDYHKLQEKWFGEYEPEYQSKNAQKWIVAIFLFIIVASILFSVWIYVLRRIVSNKTKELNQELENRLAIEKQLKVALDESKKSDRTKSAFLATMSHELRTPLNSIIGFSDIIDENSEPEMLKLAIEQINKSGTILLSIVDDLMDISLIESGQISIKLNYMDLENMMNSISRIIEVERHKINKLHVKFTLNIHPELKSIRLLTDQSKLQQVFINLLKNALKFTDEGEVIFGISEYSLAEKLTIVFYVEDTGIGIDKLNHESIFNLFEQVEQSATKKYAGVGIGLSISKKIIEKLNGEIWLDSSLKEGTIFYVKLVADYEMIDDIKNA